MSYESFMELPIVLFKKTGSYEFCLKLLTLMAFKTSKAYQHFLKGSLYDSQKIPELLGLFGFKYSSVSLCFVLSLSRLQKGFWLMNVQFLTLLQIFTY